MNRENSSSRKPASLSDGSQSHVHLHPSDKHHQSYQKALRLIAEEHYQKAVDLLNSSGQSPPVLNAKGVCLLRLGSIQSALQVYRSYILQPGGAWARTDMPISHVLNFATALLLSGRPAGCLDILAHVSDPEHPGVRRLRDAISRWERQLSLWQRFNWRFGRIEPAGTQVRLDGLPGEIEPSEPGPAS